MIVEFALSFYTLLSDQAPFKMPGRAIVKTTVMMMGKLEFDVIFVIVVEYIFLLRHFDDYSCDEFIGKLFLSY